MKRLACAVGAAILLVLGVAPSAFAQYGEPTTTTTTTAPTTTTTGPTTTTIAPPPAMVTATTSNPTPQPGEVVPISVPRIGSESALNPSAPAAAVMLPGDGGADVAMAAPIITLNPDGTMSISVTVPASTPPGVYFIAIVGTTPSGAARVIIVPVVVRRQVALAAAQSTPSAPTVGATLPADVRAQLEGLQSDIEAAGGADALEAQVLDDDATLSIDGAELLVNGRPLLSAADDDDDSNRPMVAAGAVVLGGAALLVLRRRTPAISRRTK